MHRTAAAIVFLVALLRLAPAAKLPPNFLRCRAHQPDTDECLRRATNEAVVKLKNGYPEFGILPVSPLSIPKMIIGKGTGSVSVQQEFTDLQLYGIDLAQVTKFNSSLDEYYMSSEALLPRLELIGDYEMSGQILILPVVGNGKCNITMINTFTTHKIIGQPVQKKGKTYMKVVDYRLTLKPERMHFQFDNLFNGQKEIGDATNLFMNENWEEIFREVGPGYEESFAIIFKSITEKVFNKVPYKDLFLD